MDVDITEAEAGSHEQPDEKAVRDKSEMKFPYTNLDDAIAVPKMVFEKAGQQADQMQLAAWMGHGSHRTGAFRVKLYAATAFGLVSVDSGEVRLTAIGSHILDPDFQHLARVQAFLAVPLFRALYEKYKGKMLPGSDALESEIVALGAAPKQRERARQTFQRSALQAGLFSSSKDRLILPPGISESMLTSEAPQPIKQRESQTPAVIESKVTANDPRAGLLVSTLPSPENGFSAGERKQWHAMADAIFDQIFGKLN
jgi:hypothetical protein